MVIRGWSRDLTVCLFLWLPDWTIVVPNAGENEMKTMQKCSLIWTITFLSLTVMVLTKTTVLAQRSDPMEGTASGDNALMSLKTELEQASRAWAKKYRQATSDEERAELEQTTPYRLFEPRFLELARTYAGQPAAMKAVQWLANCANPGPVFDEGLSLIEQHHLEDEGIQEMCRTLVFRRTPGIERFLLAVAEKHSNRNVQGLAYLSLARYLKQFHELAEDRQENEEAWEKMVAAVYSDNTIAWLRAAGPARLSARIDALCEKVISEYGKISDEEYLDGTGRHRTLADAANALSFSLHAVGSIAPDIVGVGVDGSRISLSLIHI